MASEAWTKREPSDIHSREVSADLSAYTGYAVSVDSSGQLEIADATPTNYAGALIDCQEADTQGDIATYQNGGYGRVKAGAAITGYREPITVNASGLYIVASQDTDIIVGYNEETAAAANAFFTIQHCTPHSETISLLT